MAMVLLVGGHMDGKWVDLSVEGEHYPPNVYRTLKPPSPPWFSIQPEDDLHIPEPYEDYEIEKFVYKLRSAGSVLWVGYPGWGPERDEAIIRSLFQRDVAKELLR